MKTNRVYKTVNRRMTIVGVERKLAFFVIMIGCAFFNLLGSFTGGILITAFLFIVVRMATRNDPELLGIIFRSSRLKRQYCPVKFYPVKIRIV